MKRILIKEVLSMKPENQEIKISGWVRTKRDSKGGFSFIEISDGSTIETLQTVADSTLPNYTDDVLSLTTGSSLSCTGELVKSSGKGQESEIRIKEIIVHGLTDSDYPLQKKRHSFEFLRDIAHLRPRTNTIGAIMRLRNAMSYAIHTFFQEKDFIYIHTPIISVGDCEGAGQLFHVTGFDFNRIPRQKDSVDYKKDFFGTETFLTVSGQLEAEACALALSNVYTFGPTFRAENSNTSRHLSEFWMVEPEMAFCNLDGDAELAEEFLKYIIKYALEKCSRDMEFFNKFIDKSTIERLEKIVTSSFERVNYTEAVDILKKSKKKFEFPVDWGKDLQSEHERYLTEIHFKKPLIVTDYPERIKAFYMRINDDGKTVRALDVLVPGVGEIIGGSEREDRLDVLKNKMEKLGIKTEDYWWYLELRKFGSVPHSGFGLGFERLIQFISGMDNIRDVIPFPRTPKHAKFQ